MSTSQLPPQAASQTLTLTPTQAEDIIRTQLKGHSKSTVRLLTEIKNKNTAYSYTPSSRTYIADISMYPPQPKPLPCSCFITIAAPPTVTQSLYHTNSLLTIHHLISQILAHTSIPLPPPILDASLQHLPFHVLISPAAPLASTSIVSMREARSRALVDEKELIRVEMQIGAFLGQMHSGVLGEWFGLPRPVDEVDEGADEEISAPAVEVPLGMGLDGPSPNYPSESYSWQETFTHLLETLLSEFEAAKSPNFTLDLPYEDIRRYLSRAIGSFLFDDVEVPSLVWMTGSEDDVYVFISPSSSPSSSSTGSSSSANSTPPTAGIAAILPNIAHALWGDPLLESFFSSSPSLSTSSTEHEGKPGPCQALLEAYLASGGSPPIVFPRHKTKRLWYDLFLGLVVLRERGLGGTDAADGVDRESETVIDREWALELVRRTVEGLRDAPCY
ncbi:hypothetical protein GALMADRAFT_243022 [Galerina marginata CBS 339.88]|uniref:Aminoglycoside phosphotransferase domain-containing protein n=1 Tax=Galerina marginata (strain CBS 339.88) TaxID=685588 RepID=A0A067T7M4_GALM3|nr:hypothetical protein GALMADRAFT_243022 [Galerina marginata CBS 339.88]